MHTDRHFNTQLYIVKSMCVLFQYFVSLRGSIPAEEGTAVRSIYKVRILRHCTLRFASVYQICSLSRFRNSPTFERKRQAPSRDSFQTFEQNTIDAWDDGVDDVLAMNPQVIQSTALQVRNHVTISHLGYRYYASEFITNCLLSGNQQP